MITSFGIVIILSALLCFLSKSYVKNDGDNSFVFSLLQIQGWLGLSICLWGVWEIIYAGLELSSVVTDLFYWISILLGGLLSVFTGGLLGFSMIQRLTLDQVSATEQAAAVKLRFKLVLLQVKTSYIAGIFGVWLTIYAFTVK